MGGGATFTGLGCPLSRHASGASMLGLGGFVELAGALEVDPFNCKFEISSTLRSELIEGSRALSAIIRVGIRQHYLALTISFLR